MKTGILLTLLIIGLLGISTVTADTAAIPDLKGNWTGTSVGHAKETGYDDLSHYLYKLSITEQRDRVFNGTITFLTKEDNKVLGDKGFSGVIGPDMKTIYLSEYDIGLDIGQVIDADTLEIIYLESGKGSTAAIETFTKDAKV